MLPFMCGISSVFFIMDICVFINFSEKKLSERHFFLGNSCPFWSRAVRFSENSYTLNLLVTLLLCSYGMVYSGLYLEG